MIKQILISSFLLFYFSLQSNNIQKIESYLNNLKDFSGVVGITKNGKTIFTKAYGYAHQESRITNDFTTVLVHDI